jgi:hypothetical protein
LGLSRTRSRRTVLPTTVILVLSHPGQAEEHFSYYLGLDRPLHNKAAILCAARRAAPAVFADWHGGPSLLVCSGKTDTCRRDTDSAGTRADDHSLNTQACDRPNEQRDKPRHGIVANTLFSEKSWPLFWNRLSLRTVLGGTNTASYAFGVRGGELLGFLLTLA